MNYSITNLIAAIILSIGIIFGWQYFYEKPRLARLVAEQKAHNSQVKEIKAYEAQKFPIVNRNEAINSGKRIQIKSDTLSGSINLKGIRFDDLVLLKYKQNLSEDSSCVELFSPAESANAYFAEIGWFNNNSDSLLPNADTQWNTDNEQLSPDNPANLSWINSVGTRFNVNITIDQDYLFTIKQTIQNDSTLPISYQIYGLINRNYSAAEKAVNILHQGPIGYINGNLQELSYDNLKDKKSEKFVQGILDWIGITDKYWLAAFVPDKAGTYSSSFHHATKGSLEKFQIDYITPMQVVEPQGQATTIHKLFAGPKKVDLLDRYEKQYNIKLFDRAIDFGWFYILTKPVFYAMNFFYKYVGNFGISILIVTVIIKLLMFTLANRSYRSMKKMKSLQPEIERIKNLYGQDKTKMNQQVMELYKKERVNPVSGCLPLLVQIPVFFSIYKVLYVTIEMRHASFFGWIRDLSAPDPTSIFNLFGLLPFTPPTYLMIGAWPIFMALTMLLQQRMSPAPADPTQAQVMKFMPLIFLVMFSSFPAGLLIYWSWNNILSIVQQYYINKMEKTS